MDARLFDTHAHYWDDRYAEEPGGAAALLDRLFYGDEDGGDNVGYIINVGTDIKTSGDSISLSKKYPRMYAAIGFHPGDCNDAANIDRDMAALRGLIDREIHSGKIAAIGEVGLDYHYDGTNRASQREYFLRQLGIAGEYGLPVIVHNRDAHGDCMDIIRSFSGGNKKPGGYPKAGVFHSFSGSAEMAAELISRGWYISFAGVITFKNAPRVRETAHTIPLDRFLLETDCPYLTPHPYRGKLNHSGLLKHTAQTAADLFGIGYDEIVRITNKNARELFGI